MKINKHIEIVRSSTVSLSSMGQRSCDAVSAVLSKHYTKVGVSIVNNLSDLEAVVDRSPDLAFLGMEFILTDPALGLIDSPKIWITDYLTKNGITYTGSSRIAHELGRYKSLAKQRVLDAGLKTSAFFVIKQSQSPSANDLPLTFPMFVKPTNGGGGLGIDSDSLVYTFEQLCAKTDSIAHNLKSDSLIEEYLPGREFSVAILKDEYSADFSILPVELIAPPDAQGARILSCEIKSLDAEQAVEVTDTIIRHKVNKLAADVFAALGARDYGRIDIRLDKYGTPQFLEANLIPSLISGYGSFPKACVLNINLDHESMILRIVALGLAREVDSESISEISRANSTMFSRSGASFEPA